MTTKHVRGRKPCAEAERRSSDTSPMTVRSRAKAEELEAGVREMLAEFRTNTRRNTLQAVRDSLTIMLDSVARFQRERAMSAPYGFPWEAALASTERLKRDIWVFLDNQIANASFDIADWDGSSPQDYGENFAWRG